MNNNLKKKNFFNFLLQHLDIYAFQVLNGNGDMLDLMTALKPENFPDFSKMTDAELSYFIAQTGHCSALIKVPVTLGFVTGCIFSQKVNIFNSLWQKKTL